MTAVPGCIELIDLLGLPFLASLVLIATHCQFGLQVLKRNVVFVDLALAQCAALGATVAFMQGHLPHSTAAYAWSLGFAWSAALLLSLLRHAPPRIPAEALVGVLYVATAAAALLLIEKAPQGAEHLKQVLVGSVLTIGTDELQRTVPLYAAIGLALWVATQRGWLERGGVAGWFADLGFYAAFGLVVTSSVAMAGVLLVFSFLIIPALVGLLCARRAGWQFIIGSGVGACAAAAGLAASYVLDTSTGATMVCCFALALGLTLAAHALARVRHRWRSLLRAGTQAAGALLLACVLWLAAKPRADQPVLDAAEALWPALRQLYFNAAERAAHADAEQYVRRYTAEAGRLSSIESGGTWRGAPMDDETVQKISSFQQSYQEMITGERFVMREIRSRARERLRGPALLLALGVLAGLLVSAAGLRQGYRAVRRSITPRAATRPLAKHAVSK